MCSSVQAARSALPQGRSLSHCSDAHDRVTRDFPLSVVSNESIADRSGAIGDVCINAHVHGVKVRRRCFLLMLTWKDVGHLIFEREAVPSAGQPTKDSKNAQTGSNVLLVLLIIMFFPLLCLCCPLFFSLSALSLWIFFFDFGLFFNFFKIKVQVFLITDLDFPSSGIIFDYRCRFLVVRNYF